jgi:hypothetical protein
VIQASLALWRVLVAVERPIRSYLSVGFAHIDSPGLAWPFPAIPLLFIQISTLSIFSDPNLPFPGNADPGPTTTTGVATSASSLRVQAFKLQGLRHNLNIDIVSPPHVWRPNGRNHCLFSAEKPSPGYIASATKIFAGLRVRRAGHGSRSFEYRLISFRFIRLHFLFAASHQVSRREQSIAPIVEVKATSPVTGVRLRRSLVYSTPVPTRLRQSITVYRPIRKLPWQISGKGAMLPLAQRGQVPFDCSLHPSALCRSVIFLKFYCIYFTLVK